jgi:hypothetical protein
LQASGAAAEHVTALSASKAEAAAAAPTAGVEDVTMTEGEAATGQLTREASDAGAGPSKRARNGDAPSSAPSAAAPVKKKVELTRAQEAELPKPIVPFDACLAALASEGEVSGFALVLI